MADAERRKRSFAAGYLMSLAGTPIPIAPAQKRLVAYLYNGVRLPDIYTVYTPEVQKTHPNVLIGYGAVYGYKDMVFMFASSIEETVDEEGEISSIGLANTWYLADGEWVKDAGLMIINPFWSNYDILYNDTVYLTASDPVSVYE